jgi:hypothetical protein
MITTSEVLSILSHATSVFIGYNMGPIAALKEWAREHISADEVEILFVSTPNSFYRVKGEELSSVPLSEIFDRSDEDYLLKLFHELLASVWNVSVDAISQSGSFYAKESIVWGRLVKAEVAKVKGA